MHGQQYKYTTRWKKQQKLVNTINYNSMNNYQIKHVRKSKVMNLMLGSKFTIAVQLACHCYYYYGQHDVIDYKTECMIMYYSLDGTV